jgi:ABC-type glycerol-3-phosphate transport system substrate-binding protein
MTEKWGEGAYRKVVEKNRDLAQIPFAVNPYLFTTQEAWWRNVQDVILGNMTAEEALTKANEEMLAILDQSGVYQK